MHSQLPHLIALYRSNPERAVLKVAFPVADLADEATCSSISQLLCGSGGAAAWDRLCATKSAVSQIPESKGLYMFVWCPKIRFALSTPANQHELRIVLYVGKANAKTSTLRSRYAGEYAHFLEESPKVLWEVKEPRNRKETLAKWLCLHPLEYWYLELDNSDDIEQLERRLIETINPPLNIQHALTVKTGKTTTAF